MAVRWVLAAMVLAGCRASLPLPPVALAELELVDQATHRHLGPWVGAPLRPRECVAPIDPDVDPSALVRTLQGRGVRALSLAGVRWAGTARLAALAPLELEWLDLTSATLEPGVLGMVRAPRLVLDLTNADDERLLELEGPIEELRLRETGVTGAIIPWLNEHRELRALGLAGTRLLPEEVAGLTSKRLVQLDLSELPLDDDSLGVLEGQADLEVLSLAGTQIGDPGLAHLRTLSRLTSLDLSETRITDAGLVGLENARGLTSLLLAGTAIGAPTVARLASLTGLRVLDLSRTRIDAEATRTFSLLTQLVALGLAKTPQTSASLTRLSPLLALRELDLEHTLVDAAVLDTLARLPALASLDLSDTALGDASLERLPPSVRALHLRSTGVQVARLTPLLGHLEELDVSGLDFSDEDALTVARLAQALTVLRANYTALGDRGATALAGLPSLTQLEVGKTSVTDAGLPALARTRSLRILELGLCAISDAGVVALEGSAISTLRLASTGVTDLGLAHLPRTVRVLGLFGTRLTQRSIAPLLALPKLRQVDLRQVKVEAEPLRAAGITVLE